MHRSLIDCLLNWFCVHTDIPLSAEKWASMGLPAILKVPGAPEENYLLWRALFPQPTVGWGTWLQSTLQFGSLGTFLLEPLWLSRRAHKKLLCFQNDKTQRVSSSMINRWLALLTELNDRFINWFRWKSAQQDSQTPSIIQNRLFKHFSNIFQAFGWKLFRTIRRTRGGEILLVTK